MNRTILLRTKKGAKKKNNNMRENKNIKLESRWLICGMNI